MRKDYVLHVGMVESTISRLNVLMDFFVGIPVPHTYNMLFSLLCTI